MRTSTEDHHGKPRPGHGSRQTFSATTGGTAAPPERPRQTGSRSTLASTVPAPATAAGTGAPKVMVPTAPASTGKASTLAATAELNVVAPESPQRAGEVDWSQVPLPANWERKLPKGTNRVSVMRCYLIGLVLVPILTPLSCVL